MDDSQKNLILIPISVGCITVMILQAINNGALGFFSSAPIPFSYTWLAINILIGAAVGGAVFAALFFMNKR
jgi:hypothetical protein